MALFAPSCPTYQSDQEEERSTSVGKRQDHASRVDETFSSLPRVASWPPSNQVLNITRKKEYPPMCFGPVTWQVFETCVDDGDEGLGTNRSRKGRIKLRIPFTWWQMRFEYVPSMGCPSYALNVDHIIPEDSRLGLEIEDTFMSKNLHELKTALSERRLSLYSSWGCINLFYVSLAAFAFVVHTQVWTTNEFSAGTIRKMGRRVKVSPRKRCPKDVLARVRLSYTCSCS